MFRSVGCLKNSAIVENIDVRTGFLKNRSQDRTMGSLLPKIASYIPSGRGNGEKSRSQVLLEDQARDRDLPPKEQREETSRPRKQEGEQLVKWYMNATCRRDSSVIVQGNK